MGLLAVGGVSSADHMINGATVREDNHSNEGDSAYKSFVLRRLRLLTLKCGGHENSECLLFIEDS